MLFLLVSRFNLLQSFNYTPYLFYKKQFKSKISSFCIWALSFNSIYCRRFLAFLFNLGKTFIIQERSNRLGIRELKRETKNVVVLPTPLKGGLVNVTRETAWVY
jgi:hypothetical protein